MTSKINHSEYTQKSPKKRVMFIVTQSEMGGTQKFIYNLIHYLDKEKYELLVAAGSDGKGELLRLLNAENIPTKELKFFKRDTGIFWGVFNNLKAMFEIRVSRLKN